MCVARLQNATWVPAGTLIPFENVKSCNVFRVRETRTQRRVVSLESIMINYSPAPAERRCDSLIKLSTLHILPMDALVHPSAWIMVSTSSRIGSRYSGYAARSSNALVKACQSRYKVWDYTYQLSELTKLSLTCEVVCIAAKLIDNSRRARSSIVLCGPCASSSNQLIKLFLNSNINTNVDQRGLNINSQAYLAIPSFPVRVRS